MQDGALATDGYGQSIYGAMGKYSENRSSGSGYKTRRREKGMTILNNPECLSRPLGSECGNTAKGKSGGVVGGRRQQLHHDIRGGGGQ